MNPLPLVLLLLLCLSTSSCVATAQASPEPLAPRQSLRVTSYDQRQVASIPGAERPQRPQTVRDRPAHTERNRRHKIQSDHEAKATKTHEHQPARHTADMKKPQHEDPRAERRRDIRARHGARGPRERGRLHSAPQRACRDLASTPSHSQADSPNERTERLKAARAKQRCEKRAKRNANAPAPTH